MIIKTGSVIGERYEIVELIGRGGMADVYKAHCNILNRNVAIKFLREEFASDAEFNSRFEAEARASAGLTHQNIVSVHDVGEEGGRKYIVMELVEGVTLKEYISKKGKLSWRDAVSVAGQIASALSCAHKNGIIHRDIKPHNIILTKTGIAKVADFGIARAVSGSTIVSADRNILGSAHYFSPEQGLGGEVDKTTDIYSLGVVLYEMLAGVVPFENSNPLSLAMMHKNAEIPLIENVNPDVPEEVCKIVYHAMAKEPSERYQRAELMVGDLKNVLKGDAAVHAKEIEESKKGRRASISDEKNTKMLTNLGIASISAVILIVVVLAVSFAFSWNKSDEKENDKKKPISSEEQFEKTDENEESEGEKANVPDVVNNKEKSAIETLEKAGYKVIVNREHTDDENLIGKVVKQQPEANKEWNKGSNVIIYIGEKKENQNTIVVDGVVGKTEEEAKKILEKSFAVEVEYKNLGEENKDKAGTVLEQNPMGGEKLEKGNSVNIIVGKYEEKPEVTEPPKETEDDKKNEEVQTPQPTSAPTEKKVPVNITVLSEHDDNQVQFVVDGAVVLDGRYAAGQSVGINVTVAKDEKKVVEVYVNGKLHTKKDVSF